MRISVGFAGLVLVGLFGWRLGSTLSPDALGLAVGMLFGILAGIPACLMVLASRQQSDQMYQQQQRRNDLHDVRNQYQLRPQYQQPPQPIFIAPYIEHGTRGQQIEDALRAARLYGQCIKETDCGDRAVYDFVFQIGTKVSHVSQFCEHQLTGMLGAQFRATRAGSMIQIFEQRERVQSLSTETVPQRIATNQYNNSEEW